METEISTTAEEVSKFQRLSPNPQLVETRKGIRSPTTRSNTHGWIDAWWWLGHYWSCLRYYWEYHEQSSPVCKFYVCLSMFVVCIWQRFFNPSLGVGSFWTPEHPYIWSIEVKEGYDGFHFFWELHYKGLLNFLIRCIFYFIVEKKKFSIYTNKGVGSFWTPGLNTRTIFERQQGIQCYCEGTL